MHSHHLQRIHNSLQAMDVEEPENVVLSHPPMVCQQNGDFSPEDLAWVDSCLNNDSDLSETGWSPLRDVLFEIMTRQDKRKNRTTSQQHVQESSTDEILEDELPALDPFLPTYNEDLKPSYEIEHESENVFKFWDSNGAADEMDEGSDSIFKVWDLEIPFEEGELLKQFHKSLSGNPISWKRKVPSVSLVLDDSQKGKDLKDGLLDDLIGGKDLNDGPLDTLIAGLAEMSLDKNI